MPGLLGCDALLAGDPGGKHPDFSGIERDEIGAIAGNEMAQQMAAGPGRCRRTDRGAAPSRRSSWIRQTASVAGWSDAGCEVQIIDPWR
jgi:hypothetical protein